MDLVGTTLKWMLESIMKLMLESMYQITKVPRIIFQNDKFWVFLGL